MIDVAFLQPLWLLLLPLPGFWLYQRIANPVPWLEFSPLVAIRYPLLSRLDAQDSGSYVIKGKRNPADKLLTLAMVLMLFALAQPIHYEAELPTVVDSEPVDLVLVVGTAISMELRDYVIDEQRIDRMHLTRRLLDQFVADYSGRRIGLVILGNPPMLWLPLTSDKAVVRNAIGRIQTTLGGRLTDMGASLQLVNEHFKGDGATAVVVVTDGGLQVGAVSPRSAAQQLAADGFSLYIIGIGATDVDAGEEGGAGPLYEPIDLPPLQRLAELGDGQLFHALDAGAFHEALATIEARHRQPVPAEEVVRLTTAWYWLPLLLALMLIIVAVRAAAGQMELTR